VQSTNSGRDEFARVGKGLARVEGGAAGLSRKRADQYGEAEADDEGVLARRMFFKTITFAPGVRQRQARFRGLPTSLIPRHTHVRGRG